MSVSLSIHPHSDHLDLYGEPDKSSAYSLSGHITVALSSSTSFFDRRRTARYLLQSLSLTFEGQSEIFTPSTGYSAVRLCSVTRELVPSDDMLELSNEGREDSKEPCVWNIIFNVTVPGWLPATTSVGSDELGIRYGLYATAKLLDLGENRNSPWAFATLCAPFRSKTKTTLALCPIELRRFVALPSHEPPVFGSVSYMVNNPNVSAKDAEDGKKRIPPEVLEKIQAILSVPECVDMSKRNMVVTLRTRSNGLEQEERERIRLLEVNLTLHQVEKCRSRPSASYLNTYPVPPREQQPPNDPLLYPSSIASIYDVGILPVYDRSDTNSRTFSLLPLTENGHYKFGEDNRIFANAEETDPSGEQVTWHNLELTIPFTKKQKIDDDWDVPAVLRPTASTALFTVYHDITVAVTCSYTFPDSGEVAQEKLTFVVPVTFVNVAPPPPQPPLLPSVSRRAGSQDSNTPSLPVVEPYAPTLPPYSQLYDANGERKVDYTVPLPLYTPPSPGGEATDDMSSRRMSVIEVMDIPFEEPLMRRKGDIISYSADEDEAGDEETAPLLGTSNV
ncbi:hypothetical protein P691DRAFT_799834 [Macrolepiota fuliginosa MF-IS2]|uniref:Uncharacterized protein n=1 Tax=Macrolepiota fuliginosa MF-IS2 TaxID=1400762 RepID=A0A9P5XFJ2_9AGAR|nr:hypothetical protein P691DRAFT_799834 [Macrolepiota fuliginosa MF-IS2]